MQISSNSNSFNWTIGTGFTLTGGAAIVAAVAATIFLSISLATGIGAVVGGALLLGIGTFFLYQSLMRPKAEAVFEKVLKPTDLDISSPKTKNPVPINYGRECQAFSPKDLKELCEELSEIQLEVLLADFSPDQIKALCDQFHIGFSTHANFKKHLVHHILLYSGSATYRDMVLSVEKRLGKPFKTLEKDEILKIDPHMSRFGFRACWHEESGAVVFLDPDADINSLLAFELTNGFQGDQFNQLYQKAIKGTYRNASIKDAQAQLEDGATRYTQECEQIERNGLKKHHTILKEAMASGKIDETWFWHTDEEINRHDGIKGHEFENDDYGRSHMKHYRDWYIQNCGSNRTQADCVQSVKKVGGVSVF